MTAEPITGDRHITRNPGISGGEPIIVGTRITVRQMVERMRGGDSVEDIIEALPHIGAGQIHAALSYYYDHASEIDRLIEESTPDQVLASLDMRAEKLAEGVAVIRKNSER